MIHKNLNFVIEKYGTKNILYLHGWGGDKNSLDVLKNIECATIMSLDFFSSKESFSRNYDTYLSALDVYLTLKENNIDTVSIIAHSYGGRVALILASCFDIKIEKLFLIASAGINTFDIKKYIRIINYKLVKFCVKLRVYNKNILSKYGSDDYKKLETSFKHIFRNIIRQDLSYLLYKVKSNLTILIYGTKDKITPIKIMKVLSKNIHNTKSYIIKNADHFLYLKDTKNILNIINSNL